MADDIEFRTFRIRRRNVADDPVYEVPLEAIEEGEPNIMLRFHPKRVNMLAVQEMVTNRIEEQSPALWQFLRQAFPEPGDYDLIHDYLVDPRIEFEASDLSDFLQPLVVAIGERPTGPPTSSLSGRPPTSPGSTEPSAAPA